ncbi:MAG: type IX secretion system sortase PorU [Bacteroidales bacterium]|nr:type IX secretion system sortase PorU [Bacteroidales bacterium]
MTKRLKDTYLYLFFFGILLFAQSVFAQTPYYPENSVLAEGKWYKITVSSDGLYKLTYNDFISMGFSAEEIDLDNLSVFGNGGTAISEINSEYKFSDLRENALYVNKQGRYALFYAKGPVETVFDYADSTFSFRMHPYSDIATYFVTFDPSIGEKKRMQQKESPQTFSKTLTTARAYSFHKRELTNLLNAGKLWIGERMTPASSKVSVPVVTQNISSLYNAEINIALVTQSSANVSFSVSIDGTDAQTMTPVNRAGSDIVALEAKKKYYRKTSLQNHNIEINYSSSDASDKAYVNYIDVNYVQNLVFNNNYLSFYSSDISSATEGLRYEISNVNNSSVLALDVTDNCEPYIIGGAVLENNVLSFNLKSDTVRSVVVFAGNNFPTPGFVSFVENQNLHASEPADFIIVTHKNFTDAAQRLAELHTEYDNISVLIVDVEQIYNEFSSGNKDFLAIREFLRMLYNKYQPLGKNPKNVLLFGDGTFDNKNILGYGNNYIPTYQSNSEFINNGSVFTSDDVLACLSADATNYVRDSPLIGVGRFAVTNLADAQVLVDKSERYMKRNDLLEEEDGDWRNFVMLSSDDADDRSELYFIRNAENIYRQIDNTQPYINVQKVYEDAYKEYTSSSGATYPDASKAINDRMNKGCLLFNYLGHGSTDHLSGERLITTTDISSWTNYNKLPLMITSTCEFARFDLADRQSAGEQTVLSEKGAAIALIAAARKIASNDGINTNLHRFALLRDENGDPFTFGEVKMKAKNNTSLQNSERSITLLGDPALKISLPKYNIKTLQINNSLYDDNMQGFVTIDTSHALSRMYIKGIIEDFGGNKIEDFNGKIKIYLFDKKANYHTLDNAKIDTFLVFEQQNNMLHKGFAKVENGEFEYEFIIPKDIAYNYGRAKLSYYAQDGIRDASGYTVDFVLGGIDSSVAVLESRPSVSLFLNDSNFVNGGLTDENPNLFAVIEDSIPINIAGAGLGHDIIARLDNAANTFVLNDYYTFDEDNLNRGYIHYPFNKLSDGEHTLSVKVWNIYNYSSEAELRFTVVSSDKEEYLLYNYPNPFKEQTSLLIKFNRPNSIKSAKITIFNPQGRIVKIIDADEYISTYNIGPLQWDGRLDGGGRVGNGIYYYTVEMTDYDGNKIKRTGKMLIVK